MVKIQFSPPSVVDIFGCSLPRAECTLSVVYFSGAPSNPIVPPRCLAPPAKSASNRKRPCSLGVTFMQRVSGTRPSVLCCRLLLMPMSAVGRAAGGQGLEPAHHGLESDPVRRQGEPDAGAAGSGPGVPRRAEEQGEIQRCGVVCEDHGLRCRIKSSSNA